MSCIRTLKIVICCALAWRHEPLLAEVAASGKEYSAGVVSAQPPDPALEAVRLDFDVAIAAQEGGDVEGAIALWRDIVSRAPHAAVPRANLALLQLRLGRLDEAERSMNEAIAQRRDPAFYNRLGIILRQKGDFSAARKSYEEALALDADHPHAHLNLAILNELYLGDYSVALEHYRKYAELSADAVKQEVDRWIGDLERRMKVAQ